MTGRRISRFWSAYFMSSARSCTPSLRIMLVLCTSTVLTLSWRLTAISLPD